MDFKTRFQPFDQSVKKTKTVSGRQITFVEWVQYIIRAHQSDFPDGFSVEVRMVKEVGPSAVVVMRVIDCQTGNFMDATGMAPIDKDKANWGGAMAEAESQALRRAFAKWGIGLEMYLDEDEKAEVMEANEPAPAPPTEQQLNTIKTLMWVLQEATELDDPGNPMIAAARLIRTKARDYVRSKGNYGEVYDKLIPQVREKMREHGILPVNDITFANALDVFDLEPMNPAAQALLDEQEQENGN